MTSNESRSIPAGVKRQVRQECCFGCVFCGMPVFEYEHIDDWAGVREHRPENLVLLCPTHHAAKTTGKLDRERIRLQRATPFNKGRAKTAGYKVEGDRSFQVVLAEQSTAGDLPPDGSPYHVLYLNGKTMLGVRLVDGWISPSFLLTDGAGTPVLEVEDGEITVATDVWDYTYQGSRITVRRGSRDILLEVDFSSNALRILRGQFLDADGDGFDIRDGQIDITNQGGGGICLMGDGTLGWGAGAMAVANHIKHPNLKLPGGFAVLC